MKYTPASPSLCSNKESPFYNIWLLHRAKLLRDIQLDLQNILQIICLLYNFPVSSNGYFSPSDVLQAWATETLVIDTSSVVRKGLPVDLVLQRIMLSMI